MNTRRTQRLRRCAAAALLEPRLTALLRACLFDGEACRRAWREWLGQQTDIKEFFGRADAPRGLLVLLWDAARRNDVALDPEVATYLKTAYVRDRARSQTYARLCREILDRLAAASVPVAVVRGSALAETVYGDPLLRHSATITLLFPSEEACGAAAKQLIAASVATARAHTVAAPGVTELLHVAGIPVELRSCIFYQADHRVALSPIWARTEQREISGAKARMLDSTASLTEVCGRAWLSPGRITRMWLCDAWLLVRQGNIEWNRLAALAREAQLELPLEIALSYLADELDAPVPRDVIAALQSEPKAALFEIHLAEALRLQPRGARPLLPYMGGWRERLWLGGRMLVPPQQYLRLRYGTSSRPLGQWRHARRMWETFARARSKSAPGTI